MKREDILKALNERFVCAEKVRIRELDYVGNPLAPETKAYRISFTHFGSRRSVTYWPNTVGFQG